MFKQSNVTGTVLICLPENSELQEKVEMLLSKSPSHSKDKLEEQVSLFELLCQHRAGMVTSADVTEIAKQSMET